MYSIKYICNIGWNLDKYLIFKEKKIALIVNTVLERSTDLYYFDLRIFLHTEPEDIIKGLQYFLFTHWEFFDYVLTFDTALLNGLPNAKRFTLAVPWVHQAGFNLLDKKFQVSFIPGRKNTTMGHKLRHVVYRKQNKIKIPTKFVPSLEYSNELRQKVLFDTSQYNISIENSRHENYFTEKILDCFLTKTIPIYWGCPNIGEYFDAMGIIQVEKEYEIYKKLNCLDEDYYWDMQNSVDYNYNVALQYLEIGEQGSERVNYAIDELIKE